MNERNLIILALLIFVLINGIALLNTPHPKTKTLKVDSQTEYVIFKAKGIKQLKITLDISGLNGKFVIKYFDSDVSSFIQLHNGINELYISSFTLSLYLYEGSSVSNVSYSIQDKGFEISSFDILIYIVDIIIIFGFIFLLSQLKTIKNTNDLVKYNFFIYNFGLFLSVPGIQSIIPFVFILIFDLSFENLLGNLGLNLLLYYYILILANFLFLYQNIGYKNKISDENIAVILFYGNLLCIVLSSVIIAESGLIYGYFTNGNMQFMITAIYFLTFGIILSTFAKKFTPSIKFQSL